MSEVEIETLVTRVNHFSDCTSISRTRKIKLMGVGKIKNNNVQTLIAKL